MVRNGHLSKVCHLFSIAVYFASIHCFITMLILPYLHQVLSEYLVKTVISLTSTQFSYLIFRIMSYQDHLLDLVSDLSSQSEDQVLDLLDLE